MNKRRISVNLIVFLVIIHFLGCNGTNSSNHANVLVMDDDFNITARQPYENKGHWEWNAPIEGPGYCGPASLYHIIAYYDDQGSYYYRVQSLFSSTWGDGMLDIPVITSDHPTPIGETEFGQFIQPDNYGSGWDLLDNITHLYYTLDLNDNVYDAFVCSSYTEPDAVEVRQNRLDNILENVLEKDVPVVIHLSSAYPGYGHYVTLIGYDPVKGYVYYVDSLKNDSGIISVPVSDFLSSNFYNGGLLYSARWDGEWMAFWHRGKNIVCTPCVESKGDE
ncbi:MAG: C39 family peptidase [Proteobacteria bacterium]|nr:C39 family peptidase [Pseudomonadota bacterium]